LIHILNNVAANAHNQANLRIPGKFAIIEISYLRIKRMDNTLFASMIFFDELLFIAHWRI